MFLTNFIQQNSENHKELLSKEKKKSKDGMDFMLQEHITLSYITF